MSYLRSYALVRKLDNAPSGSALVDWSAGADYQDSYAIRLERPTDRAIYDIVEPALAAPPEWLRRVFRLRDALVRPFGVMTTASMRQAAKGQHIDFFRVLSKTPDELILGEDDRHLDFRVSFLKCSKASGTLIVATTVVRIRNRFGRAYLFLILPFHKLIVRRSLRRLAISLQSADAA